MDFRYKDKSFHKDSQLLTNLRNSLFYKIFNKIFSKKIKLLIKRYLASEIINYNTEQKYIIINYYLKSNILFSKQNKIDLKKLGYY